MTPAPITMDDVGHVVMGQRVVEHGIREIFFVEPPPKYALLDPALMVHGLASEYIGVDDFGYVVITTKEQIATYKLCRTQLSEMALTLELVQLLDTHEEKPHAA